MFKVTLIFRDMKNLFIVDPKYIKIFSLAVLNIK